MDGDQKISPVTNIVAANPKVKACLVAPAEESTMSIPDALPVPD
jgi:hypothetical protein